MTTTDPAHAFVLLTTKLHPPRRRRTLLARPRLRDLATRSRHHALTLVSAPAGFGKTTLVADWFAAERTTAWLSLDERDDDPEQFWTYVLAALATVTPDVSANTAALLQSGGAPLGTVVGTLINDLETASQDIVLVLDDYHVITAPEIHDSVAFLLEHLPPQLSLVIVTRADPPLPLASLRADGDLLEVRAADLRFTADEAAEYLNGAMELTLTTADVDVLEARTEGWIAALQLAALSMQGRDDPASFISEFAGDDRFILDYLADEVLDRQTARVRDFLLDTSFLSRLTGSLCAAVTGQDDAKAILDELDRSNMFLVPLDDRRTWYRYHHLFGDVVRAKLVDERPDRVAELHRRASDWYADEGELGEAIIHALAADDPERAAKLIELAAPAMQRARQESQLRSWLEALPAALYDDRPVLAMALVGARMATGDADDLDPLLEIVDSWLVRDDSPIVFDDVAYRRLPAMAAVHRAGLALLDGDVDGTIEHARRVRDLVGADDHLQRGAAAALLGLAHWNLGDLDGARDGYIEAIACFELGDYLADVMGCSLALADIQITQGRLTRRAAHLRVGASAQRRQPRPAWHSRHARRTQPARHRAQRPRHRRGPPAVQRGTRRTHGTARSTPTAGGSPWRDSTKPRAISTRRSNYSHRPRLATTPTTPPVSARSALRKPGSRSSAETSTPGQGGRTHRGSPRMTSSATSASSNTSPSPAYSSPSGPPMRSSRPPGCFAGCSPPPTTGTETAAQSRSWCSSPWPNR